jgi:hypothetical protein
MDDIAPVRVHQIESLAVAATVTLECVQGKSFGGAPYGGSLMGQALVGCDGGLLLVNASCASCEAFLQLYHEIAVASHRIGTSAAACMRLHCGLPRIPFPHAAT